MNIFLGGSNTTVKKHDPDTNTKLEKYVNTSVGQRSESEDYYRERKQN